MHPKSTSTSRNRHRSRTGSSCPRRRASRKNREITWIPAFAGMTFNRDEASSIIGFVSLIFFLHHLAIEQNTTRRTVKLFKDVAAIENVHQRSRLGRGKDPFEAG